MSSDFGLADLKSEGESVRYDTGCTDQDVCDQSVYMELCLDIAMSRSEVIALVNSWLTENNWRD